MSEPSILYALDDGVARITLNRPDRLNSLNVDMHERLRAALNRAGTEARAVLLTGAGRGFCAGQDLADRSVAADAAPPDLGASVEQWYKPLVLQLQQLPMPVVGAVNGVAAGAGANLALACDLVIAARSASFIQSFAKIGLIPDTGGTWALPRRVGLARALGLALTGDKLPAEQAAAWGLIWQCVDDDALADTATALARGLAAGPTRGLAATKALLRESWQNDLPTQLDRERDTMAELGRSDDYREGVAAFINKRAPRFTGK